MTITTEALLKQIEDEIRLAFPNVLLEFSRQYFFQHVELWVYVLNMSSYAAVKDKCRVLRTENHLDDQTPEIWLIAQTWSGPWAGGGTATELRNETTLEQRRNEMRERIRLANLV